MKMKEYFFKEKILKGESFPAGVEIDGNLDLSYWESPLCLPEGLVVNGALVLYGSDSLFHLPEGLVVKGILDINGCTSLTHLPPGLVIWGTIYCDRFHIEAIPFEDLPLYVNYKFTRYNHEYFTRRLQGKAA
jgi:hypothetical protein